MNQLISKIKEALISVLPVTLIVLILSFTPIINLTSYELCVMKKYAMPLLKKIDLDSEFFPLAQRLIRFLKYFVDLEDKWVPCNSNLREFIGDSCFQDV